MTDYKNKMEVVSNIIDLPTVSVSWYPTRDTYVSQAYPYYTFNQNVLLANHNAGQGLTNKTLFGFEIPDIPKERLDKIASAKLVLTPQSKATSNRNFVIKYHIDNKWTEDGVTWMGQPVEQDEVIAKQTLSPTDAKLEFDFTEIFKANKGNQFNLAMTMSEDEADGDQAPFAFYSKEYSNINARPVIVFSYFYEPAEYDYFDLHCNLIVRRNVPDTKTGEKEPELPGQLFIDKGINANDLDARIILNTGTGEDDLDGEVIVKRTSPSKDDPPIDLPGEITVVRNVPNSDEKAPDLDGELVINFYFADSDLTKVEPEAWKHHVPAADLESVVVVPLYTVPDTGVNAPELDSVVIVKRNSPSEFDPPVDLPGVINMKSYTGEDDLDGVIIVRRNSPGEFDPPVDLPGVINMKTGTGEDDLDGVIIMQRNVPTKLEPAPQLIGIINIRQLNDLDGVLYINERGDLDGSVFVAEREDLPSVIKIQRNVPNKDEDAPDLDSELTINLHIADDGTNEPGEEDWHIHENSSKLDGVITLKTYDVPDLTNGVTAPELDGVLVIRRSVPNDDEPAPDLDGSVSIKFKNVPDPENGVPAPDLDAVVTVRAHVPNSSEPAPDLDAVINVKQYYVPGDEPAPDLPGYVNIKHVAYLDGQIYVADRNDLLAYLITRPVDYEFLDGRLKIVIGNASYAFIM